MAKGKKVAVKEIKRLEDDVVLINGKEYILLEECEDVESAILMKISSNGNRLLRFKDETKIANLDVKRDIDIVKYSFKDPSVAKKFSKGYDKTVITPNDTREEIGNASSFKKARKIINTYISKDGVNYDQKNGKTTFYVTEEA